MRSRIFSAALVTTMSLCLLAAGSVNLAAAGERRVRGGSWTQDGEASPWLGVFLDDSSDQGLRIRWVVEDSPAATAGLEDGDIIISIDGTSIGSSGEFFAEFRALKPGDTPQLVVRRRGEDVSVQPTLDEKTPRRMKMSHFNRGMGRHGDGEVSQRGYLGVHLQSLTDELRQFFGAPDGEGILVARVEEGSPAAAAGVQVGDVIVEAEGRAVRNSGDLTRVLHPKREGESVSLTVYRNGAPLNLNAAAAVKESHGFNFNFNFNNFLACGEDDSEDCSLHIEGLEGLKGLQGLEALEGLRGLGDMGDSMIFIHEGMGEWKEQLHQQMDELRDRLHQMHEDNGDGDGDGDGEDEAEVEAVPSLHRRGAGRT